MLTKDDDLQTEITTVTRLKRWLLGKPRNLQDRSLFHKLSLIPFLAWIGLGSDGLSSSSYGPEEAFLALHEHTYLAVGLSFLTILTITLISVAYSKIIEDFPHGGGGYVVATKLLGSKIGMVSGCALLVDYVLTITVSLASAGDALFSFLPLPLHSLKLPLEMIFILTLIMINLRGVRESVLLLMPIFLIFLFTHVILILGGIILHAPQLPATIHRVSTGFQEGYAQLGLFGLLSIFVHSYSMGGGTYTGIEAVSNGLPIMREPRVHTAKRTMLYMALSLSFTASGLLLCYLLWRVKYVPGKTMNAVLLQEFTQNLPTIGPPFVILTLIAEGLLLIVAAQTGFIDGPRVLANMAIDSWVPKRFAALSERLTTQNGVLLMGISSLIALLYTKGNIRYLIIMYSINVFLTFTISMFGMAYATFKDRKKKPDYKRRLSLFMFSFLFCSTILMITIKEKFSEGGWITLLVTLCVITLCFLIKRHYRLTASKLAKLYNELSYLTKANMHNTPAPKEPPPFQYDQPTAVILVASFAGLGIHTFLNIFRAFPGYFKNVIFISVGVIDSGEFKGEHAVVELEKRTKEMLERYVDLAHKMKIPAKYRLAIATDPVHAGEHLCLELHKEFSPVVFFAGKIIFQKERWYQNILHNETALSIQKRLQWAGLTMTIVPAKVN